MEIGKTMAAAGLGLFLLGGLSVYLLMADNSPAAGEKPAPRQQAAITPPEHTETTTEQEIAFSASSDADQTDATPEMTHAAFLAAAEAKREQDLEDKAEADRLGKLLAIKQNSMECKFWKQQQKTTSAAAKIEEKIIKFCTLQDTSSEAASSDASL